MERRGTSNRSAKGGCGISLKAPGNPSALDWKPATMSNLLASPVKSRRCRSRAPHEVRHQGKGQVLNVWRRTSVRETPVEAQAAKWSSKNERLGKGSGSEAACRQAERGPEGNSREWGKKRLESLAVGFQRAGEKTDDWSSMKHILFILSKHPQVLSAPTKVHWKGRVACAAGAWGMLAVLRSSAPCRQQSIRSFNRIRKILRHGQGKQWGGKYDLL